LSLERKSFTRQIIHRFLSIADVLLFPFVFIFAFFLKMVRFVGFKRLPCSRAALLKAGCFPIRDHYHEPLFNKKYLRYPLSKDRKLPGIDWNVDEQLQMLDLFAFSGELLGLSRLKKNDLDFFIENDSFGPGDAEYWYNIIRLKKPRRIIEIGSGYSTLMAMRAISVNKSEDANYSCKHICIEPYERPWLDKTNAVVIRQRVEELDYDLFMELNADDILFIDSSHVIRPQGDLIFEYLELMPQLKKGVIVHIHDIFSPKDYPEKWLIQEVRFWNEQYLLEAYLTENKDWKIIGAVNFLYHNYSEKLQAKSPFLVKDSEPRSFYIQKK